MAHQSEPRPARLSRAEMISALPKIDKRIAELNEFDVETIQKRFDPTINALHKKVDSTLIDIVGHDTLEYRRFAVDSLDTLPIVIGGGNRPIREVREAYSEGIRRAVISLETLRELFVEKIASDEVDLTDSKMTPTVTSGSTRRVFVVHGHDAGTKETVARFLTKLNLEPVILHEQANQGRTIIEKFENHAAVDFAIALFTPDDMGHAAAEPGAAKPRARQNVVLELGFFLGRLGRERVCVLYTSGVELPSDYSGVLFVEFDSGGTWKYSIAREMRAVGIDVDLNML